MKSVSKGIRLLFNASPFIGLLPFVILSFFCFPQQDDYYLHFSTTTLGWWGSVKSFFLVQDSGRFGSFPLLLSFAKQDWVMNNYWIIPLIFLSLTYFSFYFLLKNINNYALSSYFSSSRIYWLSAALLLVFINIITQPAAAFFWMTAAFQNQLAIIYACFLMGLIIKDTHQSFSVGREIAISILLILICGSLEPVSMIVQMCFIYYYIYHIINKTPINKKVIRWHLLALIASAALLFMPGTQHRAGYIAKDLSPLIVLGLSIYEFIQSLYHLLSEPQCWLLLLTTIILKQRSHINIKTSLILQWLPVFLLWLIYLVLSYGINGRIAARTENSLLFFLLTAIIFIGLSMKDLSFNINTDHIFFKLLIALILITGRNSMQAYSDIPSAVIYKKVMQKRIEDIRMAKRSEERTVKLESFTNDRKKIIDAYHRPFMQKAAAHLDSLPRTIFIHDDLSDYWAKSMAQFYGIDTIKTYSGVYPRWGLDNKY
jgi:hypothetical protein